MNATAYATAAVPLIVLLVQGFKQALPKEQSIFAFPLAVVLGVAVGFLIQFGVPDVKGSLIDAVFGGLGIGLSAAGLYSGGNAVQSYFSPPSQPLQTSAPLPLKAMEYTPGSVATSDQPLASPSAVGIPSNQETNVKGQP